MEIKIKRERTNPDARVEAKVSVVPSAVAPDFQLSKVKVE